MIRFTRHSAGGYRCHVAGHHVHHGLIGALSVVAGAALAIHDRADWRRWVPDFLVTSPNERTNDGNER